MPSSQHPPLSIAQDVLPNTLDLSPEAMRQLGYAAVDQLVHDLTRLSSESPIQQATRASMDFLLHEPLPEDPSDPMAVLDYVNTNVLAKTSKTNHNRFFSFVPSPSNYVSAVADFLASGYNVFSGAWSASPGAAELELLTVNWLLKLFGFPVKEGGGLFVSGGSMANLIGLSAARTVKLNNVLTNAIMYCSDQTHSSVVRAMLVLGFTKDHVRLIPSDDDFRLPVDALKTAIETDLANGLTPFCVVGNAGTTNTGAVDPLNQLALLCRQFDLWFHVDGAYGGAAVLTDAGKRQLDGIELADSLAVDPHKWLFQPYEIGCVLVRNHEWLSGTYRMNPEYLRDIESNGEEINFYDYGIQLTRRFRALKFYMSLKTFGLKGFRAAIERGVELAHYLEVQAKQSPEWEIIAPACLGVVSIRYNPNLAGNHTLTDDELNQLNQQLSEGLLADGYAMVVTTILRGQKVLRFCTINPRTTEADIDATLAKLSILGKGLLANHPTT